MKLMDRSIKIIKRVSPSLYEHCSLFDRDYYESEMFPEFDVAVFVETIQKIYPREFMTATNISYHKQDLWVSFLMLIIGNENFIKSKLLWENYD